MTKCNPFVVADGEKCIGCRLCEMACFMAHEDRGALTVGNIETPITPRLYLVREGEISLPVGCHHCEDAPCLRSCALGAIYKENSRILIDEEKCVVCKSCMLSCPFGAIELVEKASASNAKNRLFASKCDRCKDLESPACVDVCPQNALQLFQPETHRRERMKKAALGLMLHN